MNQNVIPLIESFRQLRVLVIGDAMLDVLVKGTSDRLCREAPVPVVRLGEHIDAPGGAGNAAANLAALGARVRLIAAAGRDEEGQRLLRELESRGVDVGGVVRLDDYETLTKTRIVAGNQILVRLDRGDARSDDRAADDALVRHLDRSFAWADVCVISDYGYGVVSDALLARLRELRTRNPRPLVADGKDPTRFAHLRPTAIKPNYEEVTRVLGAGAVVLRGESGDLLQSVGERVLALTGAQIAAVTLDSEGALVFEAGHPPYRTYATPYADSRATGAGDSFVSALALALAAGADAPAAAELASAASAVVVRKEGTCTCSCEELTEAIAGEAKVLPDVAHLVARLEEKRRQGKRIVFTNGCFDIIHRGHVAYLNTAKEQGDLLVVGLNSDASVARLKGPDRPINCLDDRLQILGALSCIDYLVPFEEDSPVELIRQIKPDVFVKGGDYTRETLPEAGLVESLGGRIALVDYVENRSTTSMIGRIRGAAAS